MPNSFLDQFLDLGLLLGVDDTNLGKLDAAATKLASTLQSDADALRRYAYVLFDADIPDTDPTLDAVEEVVKQEWRSLRGSHSARPVQLLRAVLGQALVKATAEAEFHADTVLWLTAGSVLPYSNLGPERHLIVEMFEEFGRKAEQEALSAWDLAASPKPSSIKLPQKPTFKVESAVVDEKTLATHLKASAGPTDVEGKPTGPSPNPYWAHNTPQQWAMSFGDRAASGITEIMDGAFSDSAGNVQKALGQMPAYVDNVSKAVSDGLRTIQEQSIQSVSGSQTRLNLLWWKESLYSPSLQTGYRRMQNPIATLVTLAYDFHQLLPETYPQSAEYFLREVVYDVLRRYEEQRWSLSEFCSEVMTAGSIAKQLAGLTESAAGRVPLLVFLSELARGEAKPADAFSRVGIGEDVHLSGDDLAVWILRELRASHLATIWSDDGGDEESDQK